MKFPGKRKPNITSRKPDAIRCFSNSSENETSAAWVVGIPIKRWSILEAKIDDEDSLSVGGITPAFHWVIEDDVAEASFHPRI